MSVSSRERDIHMTVNWYYPQRYEFKYDFIEFIKKLFRGQSANCEINSLLEYPRGPIQVGMIGNKHIYTLK